MTAHAEQPQHGVCVEHLSPMESWPDKSGQCLYCCQVETSCECVMMDPIGEAATQAAPPPDYVAYPERPDMQEAWEHGFRAGGAAPAGPAEGLREAPYHHDKSPEWNAGFLTGWGAALASEPSSGLDVDAAISSAFADVAHYRARSEDGE